MLIKKIPIKDILICYNKETKLFSFVCKESKNTLQIFTYAELNEYNTALINDVRRYADEVDIKTSLMSKIHTALATRMR